MPWSTVFLIAMPLASASPPTVSIASSSSARRSTLRVSSCSLPETMRLMSRRSAMSCACALVLREMMSNPRSSIAESSRPRIISCVHPRIALSGVLSSCETMATNSSLIRLARSASARALRSASSSRSRSAAASCRSTSERRRSVISRAIFETPMIAPDSSRTGDIVREMSISRRSLVMRTVSKCSTRSPARIRLRIRSSSCWRLAGISIRTGRPISSDAG